PLRRFHVEATADSDIFRFWTKLQATTVDETADPAPQLTVFRVLGDKHQRLNPHYDDAAGRVQDLHHVLGRVWADLVVPSIHSMQARTNIVKPVGKWKPPPRYGRYLVWEGVGWIPIHLIFSPVTDGHISTGSALSHARRHLHLGRHQRTHRRRRPAPRLPFGLSLSERPHRLRLPHRNVGSPSLQFAAAEDDDPAAFNFHPPVDCDGNEPSPPDTSVDNDGDDWPALRTVPWISPVQGSATALKPSQLKED
ncbi:hypothetical protein CYMTET_35859, partial [Cymbomonas tetramitiformis]